jgi:5'(3')-deoxyribonucleotidase
MGKIKTIAFDLDDVLADFMGLFAQMAYKKLGKESVLEAPVDWDWSNWKLSKEELDGLWFDLSQTENFWIGLKPEPGIDNAQLKRLEKKNNLVFPTARALCPGFPVGFQSALWLQMHTGLLAPSVFVSYNKGGLARELKYDYFIDDRPKNVIEVKEAVPECRVFLQDSSHNQTFDEVKYGIVRVRHVNDFMNTIEQEESK